MFSRRWEEWMHRRRLLKLVVGLSAAALLATTAAGTASSLRSTKAQAGSYNVGIVYSRTGLLSAYGSEYIEGLKLGLKYATNGTNKVNGKTINLTLTDDGTDPTKAVSAAKDLIGQGYKIIAGTESSGVALQLAPLADQNHVLYISGPAASDAITGLNKYTFRSGRQTTQDVLTADSFLTGANKKIVVFAQDSAFGQGNVAAVTKYIGGKGHSVSSVLVPLTATDLTPFAQQAKQANADLIFVAWAGTTAGSMWKALDQQGVFNGTTKVVTGLAEKGTWKTFDPAAATKIQFLSHYVYTAPKNKVNDWMVTEMRKRSQAPDLFTPDGFTAAQMIVHALEKGDYDVDKMVASLEGWKFLAPKGFQAIRPQDHAMLQPMFQVHLLTNPKSTFGYTPKVLGTASSYKTAPPVTPFK
jgi:branched-chain amino acid transport system substrate-binding protein